MQKRAASGRMGRHPAIVSAVVGGVVLLAAPEQLNLPFAPSREAGAAQTLEAVPVAQEPLRVA